MSDPKVIDFPKPPPPDEVTKRLGQIMAKMLKGVRASELVLEATLRLNAEHRQVTAPKNRVPDYREAADLLDRAVRILRGICEHPGCIRAERHEGGCRVVEVSADGAVEVRSA